MKAKIKKITVSMARDFLANQIDNQRSLNKNLVRKYARDMRDGAWTLSTDAIGFSKEGKLINGQHRLKALVESGVEGQFLVAEKIDAEAFANLDNVAKRTNYDRLSIIGSELTKKQSEIVTFLAKFKIDRYNFLDLQSIFKEYEHEIKSINHNKVTAPIRAALVLALKHNAITVEQAEDFMSSMMMPVNENYKSALLLRNRIDRLSGMGWGTIRKKVFLLSQNAIVKIGDKKIKRLHEIDSPIFPIS